MKLIFRTRSPFRESLTILEGPDGTGKSSLCEAFGSTLSELLRLPRPNTPEDIALTRMKLITMEGLADRCTFVSEPIYSHIWSSASGPLSKEAFKKKFKEYMDFPGIVDREFAIYRIRFLIMLPPLHTKNRIVVKKDKNPMKIEFLKSRYADIRRSYLNAARALIELGYSVTVWKQ